MLDITSIYCLCDDFFKNTCDEFSRYLLTDGTNVNYSPSPKLSTSEVMTILISFHLSGFHDLKHFYSFVCTYRSKEFTNLVSYGRFVELIPSANIFLYALFLVIRGQQTGVAYMDASAIPVCKNKRIYSHKVFKGLAKRGKTTMGWFFGFKIHLVINSYGQILNFTLTTGNVDDRKAAPQILEGILGSVYADKGYIDQSLFKKLFERGCKLVTSLRSNMKPKLHTLEDSENLSKRSFIESVFNVLKNSCRIEHSRHRSPKNFIANLLGALCAYMMRFFIEDYGNKRLQAV